MDRASGSGVFARDPDALLDLIELELSDEVVEQQTDSEICGVCVNWLKRWNVDLSKYSRDDLLVKDKVINICKKNLSDTTMQLIFTDINKIKNDVKSRTAWRIEGTLREFPKFTPLNLWFKYPIHVIDDTDILKDISTEDFNIKKSPYKRNFSKKKTAKERSDERKASLEISFQGQEQNGKATIQDLAEAMGCSEKTVKRYISEHGGFELNNDVITRK